MPPREPAAALRCFDVPADACAAFRPCRRRERRFSPTIRPAAVATVCLARLGCAADCHTPQLVRRVCPANVAAPAAAPECTTALRSLAGPPASNRCDSPCPLPPLRAPAHSSAHPPPVLSPPPPTAPLLPRTFLEASSCHPDRPLAPSPPPPLRFPSPPRAPLCGPDACSRPSSL